MKKNLITLIAIATLLSTACSSAPMSSEEKETEFLERFVALIQEGDFSKENLNQVWLIGDTPPGQFEQTVEGLKKLKEQGIGETGYHEIFPKMKEGMNQPIQLEGKTYVPNLEPYKMIQVKYSEGIPQEHGSEKGWSYVVGEFDGKLYMMGLKALPGGGINSETAPRIDTP